MNKKTLVVDQNTPPTALTFDDVQLVPQYSEIPSRSSEYITTKTKISRNYTIDFPVISANMDTVTGVEMIKALHKHGANGVIHRMQSIIDECEEVDALKEAGVFPIIASIGVELFNWNLPLNRIALLQGDIPPMDDLYRAKCLIESGANIILIDVAHGHHIKVRAMIEHLITLRKHFDYKFDIIAGNVATKQAVQDLIEWGADGVKCGVGSGAACTTRVNTGFGVPSFTSLCECVHGSLSAQSPVPIIWDGGIKTSGDMAKALAAGANAVMIGSLFAGTEESPGLFRMKGLYPNKGIVKEYRGSASFNCKISHGYAPKNIEGISTTIAYKGPVEWVINYLKENFYSSLSYAGACSIEELQKRARFVRITQLGVQEAAPHIEFQQ